jgi:hypothetical protein
VPTLFDEFQIAAENTQLAHWRKMFDSCIEEEPLFGAPAVPPGANVPRPRLPGIKFDQPKFTDDTNVTTFHNDFDAHMGLCEITDLAQQGNTLRFLLSETLRQEIDTTLGLAIWNTPVEVFNYLERQYKPPNVVSNAINNINTMCMHKAGIETYFHYGMRNFADADIRIEDPLNQRYKLMWINGLNNFCVDRFSLRTHAESLLRENPLMTVVQCYFQFGSFRYKKDTMR